MSEKTGEFTRSSLSFPALPLDPYTESHGGEQVPGETLDAQIKMMLELALNQNKQNDNPLPPEIVVEAVQKGQSYRAERARTAFKQFCDKMNVNQLTRKILGKTTFEEGGSPVKILKETPALSMIDLGACLPGDEPTEEVRSRQLLSRIRETVLDFEEDGDSTPGVTEVLYDGSDEDFPHRIVAVEQRIGTSTRSRISFHSCSIGIVTPDELFEGSTGMPTHIILDTVYAERTNGFDTSRFLASLGRVAEEHYPDF